MAEVVLSEQVQQELSGKVIEFTYLLRKYIHSDVPFSKLQPPHQQRHQQLMGELEEGADLLTTEQLMDIANAYAHPEVKNKQKQQEWANRVEQRGASTYTFNLAKAYYEGANGYKRDVERAIKLFQDLNDIKENETLRERLSYFLDKPQHKALKAAVFPLTEAQQQFLSKAKVTARLLGACGISKEPLIGIAGDEDEGIVNYVPGSALSQKDLDKLVMTPDGHIYARQALTDWLNGQPTEPTTRNPLKKEELIALTAEQVDFEELNQRLGLRALERGFQTAAQIVEKAEGKLRGNDKSNLLLLKAKLTQQAEQVKAVMKKPEKLDAHTYHQLLAQACESIKENSLTKSLREEEPAFLRVIKKYVPFKWVHRTLSKFFVPPLTPEKAVIKDTVQEIKNSIKLTAVPKNF